MIPWGDIVFGWAVSLRTTAERMISYPLACSEGADRVLEISTACRWAGCRVEKKDGVSGGRQLYVCDS